LILTCPTGRGMLIVSGAIEDDLLVFGELADSSREFVQRNGAFQLHTPKGFFAIIGTHQDAGAGFHSGINLFRRNAQNCIHITAPFSLKCPGCCHLETVRKSEINSSVFYCNHFGDDVNMSVSITCNEPISGEIIDPDFKFFLEVQ
jgi:hypothetical protein